jgi:hypothetical protein
LVALYYLIIMAIINVSVPPVTEKNTLINIFDPALGVYYAFIVYALFHAFAIWGAVFFEKLHTIKIAFAFFICVVIILLINQPLLHNLINKDAMGNMPFLGGLTIKEHEHYWHLDPDQNIIDCGKAALVLIVALLWGSSYYRLKEKEV